MICKLTRAHDGRLLLEGTGAEGRKHSAVFEPGWRTMTGARHKNGTIRCLTARDAREYLAPKAKLRRPYDCVDLPSDKGVFDVLGAVDISMNARRCHSIVSQPLRALIGACALEMRKL